MKPITEYNFREIVGHFVKLYYPQGKCFIDPNCEEYIAYVYIDMQIGITLEIIGGFMDGRIRKNESVSNKIRYSEDIILELYDNLDDEMLKTAEYIKENYTPDWIVPVRENPAFDPYRNKRFPDELHIPVHSLKEQDGKLMNISEVLRIHPVCTNEGHLYGTTKESGLYFERGTLVVVARITSGEYKYSAMTFEMTKTIAKSDDPASFFMEL